jgi:hypothetical protein
MADDHGDDRRLDRWQEGPRAGEGGWLALSDDDLLYRINALPQDHAEDETLLAVVRSDRHFFVRQEAAKRLRDPGRLKEHSGDRHIGPILVRVMKREEDVAYLERLMAESGHLDVRKAAEAQLRAIARAKAGATGED